MAQKYSIHCLNNGETYEVSPGETLLSVAREHCPQVTDPKTGRSWPVLAALVNNKLKDLGYRNSFRTKSVSSATTIRTGGGPTSVRWPSSCSTPSGACIQTRC